MKLSTLLKCICSRHLTILVRDFITDDCFTVTIDNYLCVLDHTWLKAKVLGIEVRKMYYTTLLYVTIDR